MRFFGPRPLRRARNARSPPSRPSWGWRRNRSPFVSESHFASSDSEAVQVVYLKNSSNSSWSQYTVSSDTIFPLRTTHLWNPYWWILAPGR